MALRDVFQRSRWVSGRLRLLYPFIFAVLPLLNVLSRSPGGSDLRDMGLMIVVMLGTCAVLYGVVSLLVKGRGTKPVVSLIVFLIMFWFYAYSPLTQSVRTGSPGASALAVVAAAAALSIAAAWWLARRPAFLDRATTFLALTCTFAAGWMLAQTALYGIRTRGATQQSALVRGLGQPLAGSPARASRGESRRDIYLIILDEYANSAVLRERFGFDNRAFEDSLLRLGFTIPRRIRSNYVHTLLSLPSLLNFSHLTALTSEVGPLATDATIPNYLVENNRTAAFLKARDYKFLFFPSQWWISTRRNRNADSEFKAWHGFDPRRDATRSDLRRWLVRVTALPSDYSFDADHVKRTLEGVQRVPSMAEPTFAFAHVLNPHRPIVFNAGNCPRLRRRSTEAAAPVKQDAYIRQVECLNDLLLVLVTDLLRSSSPAPIILLVGDHGTNSLRYSSAKSAESVSPAQARERFGAFGAFYLPEAGGRLLTDSVTLVNVIPKVLNYYFDARIPLAADSLYMSLEETPYLFAPVDPASLDRE
ncbi:MAG: hypothetical protein ABI703_01255 [Gemmatimonadales bacterium]